MSEMAELNKLCIICLDTETLTPIPRLKYQEISAQTLINDSNLIKFESEDLNNRSLCRKCCQLLYSFHCMRKQFFESQETFQLLLKREETIKNLQTRKISEPNSNACTDCVCSNVTASNLSTICRICFQQTDIQPIGNLKIDETSAIKLYEEFSNQNIHSDEMLCLTCLDQLFAISKFRNKFENHDFIVQNLQIEQINVKLEPDQTNYYEPIDDKLEIIPNELITQTNTVIKKENTKQSKHEITEKLLTYKNKVTCRHCPLTFDTKEEFTQHTFQIRTHKTFSMKIECGACKRLLSNASNYKAHVDVIHRGVRPFECETCLRQFSFKMNLERHLLTHLTERPFLCDRCGAKFIQKALLTNHIVMHHDDAKNYRCKVCPKRFSFKSQLGTHMRSHADKRPYSCGVCTNAFKTQSDLNNHIKTHAQTKPYKCEICGKCFRRSQHLTHHKRSHTGDKPFVCEVCHKRFTCLSNLKGHVRIHTGEMPYKCEVCFKLFRVSGTLRKHMLMHEAKCENVDDDFFA